MRNRIRRFALLALPIWLIACGSDDDSSGPGSNPADFSGRWDVETEVVGKRLCSGDIGDTGGFILEIVQRGGSAQLLLENSVVDLIVDGSNARGTVELGDRVSALEIKIEEGELSGTMTRTDNSVPCTEIESLVGTRDNAVPDSDLAGYWDLHLVATRADCQDDELGAMLDLCRRIQIESNTVWLEDEEGDFVGVGDGPSAYLERYLVDDWTRIDLTLENGALTGSLSSWDPEELCELRMDVVGTRRQNPCGEEEPQPADFSGYWNQTNSDVVNGCGLPVDDGCEYITRDGNTFTLENDGLQGTVLGNMLSIHEEEPVGGSVTLIIDIELVLAGDGNSYTGTRSVEFVNSQNPGESCETSTTVTGTRALSCSTN